MIIGIAQQGLSFAEAAHSYTILTVGDGLVTQIPALIVSTSAGLLVSKAGIAGSADKALLGQLSGYPKALGMSGAVMLVMALLPGIPMLPFVALGGGAAALAFIVDKRAKQVIATEAKKADAAAKTEAADEPIAAALKMDDLKLELGYALLAAGQFARRHRQAHRADQGAAPLARRRDGLRDAGGAHPRQCAARRQRLRHQDQGGRGRLRQAVGRPAHGHGPGRRPGEPARHPHHRADIRIARDLDRRRAQGRGDHEGLHGGRLRHRAGHASDRTAQEQHGGIAVLRRGAEALEGTAQGAGRPHQGPGADADHGLGHPARAADSAVRARLRSAISPPSWRASPTACPPRATR